MIKWLNKMLFFLSKCDQLNKYYVSNIWTLDLFIQQVDPSFFLIETRKTFFSKIPNYFVVFFNKLHSPSHQTQYHSMIYHKLSVNSHFTDRLRMRTLCPSAYWKPIQSLSQWSNPTIKKKYFEGHRAFCLISVSHRHIIWSPIPNWKG